MTPKGRSSLLGIKLFAAAGEERPLSALVQHAQPHQSINTKTNKDGRPTNILGVTPDVL